MKVNIRCVTAEEFQRHELFILGKEGGVPWIIIEISESIVKSSHSVGLPDGVNRSVGFGQGVVYPKQKKN